MQNENLCIAFSFFDLLLCFLRQTWNKEFYAHPNNLRLVHTFRYLVWTTLYPVFTSQIFFARVSPLVESGDSVHTRRDLWRGHAPGNDWIIQMKCANSLQILQTLFLWEICTLRIAPQVKKWNVRRLEKQNYGFNMVTWRYLFFTCSLGMYMWMKKRFIEREKCILVYPPSRYKM